MLWDHLEDLVERVVFTEVVVEPKQDMMD